MLHPLVKLRLRPRDWISSNVSWDASRPNQTLALVLPDVQAATIPASTPLAQVDLPSTAHPQGDLNHAYTQYEAARGSLAIGDVNSAWNIFLQERCLLLQMFQRYYSTLRTIPNVADPKEAPLTPSAHGCGMTISP